MANSKKRGTGTINEVTNTSLTKNEKTISFPELDDEEMEKLLDK